MFEALSQVAIFLRIRSSGGSLHSAALRLRHPGLPEHPRRPMGWAEALAPGTRWGLGAAWALPAPHRSHRPLSAARVCLSWGALLVQIARRTSRVWDEKECETSEQQSCSYAVPIELPMIWILSIVGLKNVHYWRRSHLFLSTFSTMVSRKMWET